MASYTIIDFTRRGDQVALVLEAVDDEAIIASSRKALSKGTTSFAVAQGRDPASASSASGIAEQMAAQSGVRRTPRLGNEYRPQPPEPHWRASATFG